MLVIRGKGERFFCAGADIHMCTTPSPVPPHGPGVIVDGSQTVLINNLPACRQGDTIVEAIGPPGEEVKKEIVQRWNARADAESGA